MTEFDPAPWLAALGLTGTGTGAIGFFAGRRKSKADAALAEVQVVAGALEVWKSTVQQQDQDMREMRAEIVEMRGELRELRLAERVHANANAVLVEYVREGWRFKRDNPGKPWPLAVEGGIPSHVYAIVHPELAKTLTSEIPIQEES
ncbi:hypothetical protein [Gulosibacter molinativorax]|uniref:Uncharacterized protein n=1 Tax=Gulosibacter molinativorax TaxID=256821 RepID=A0ABT7CAJ9_9MICO|nr:hypothetical protein [Gulosibacter molinativorax]MDJ1372221.1 hypothetical protein [Gulosibacter molinativorax]QUY60906.1 Hypotetical protein [Gulosibacter molinativorax]